MIICGFRWLLADLLGFLSASDEGLLERPPRRRLSPTRAALKHAGTSRSSPCSNARMLWEAEPWKAPATEKSVTLITPLHCIYLHERSLAPLSLTGRVGKNKQE